MNERITRAAGAGHGQETSPDRMIAMIEAAARKRRQLTTEYRDVDTAMARRPRCRRVVGDRQRASPKCERKRTHQLVKNEIPSINVGLSFVGESGPFPGRPR